MIDALEIYRIISGIETKIANIASDDAILANGIMSKNEISVTVVTDSIPDIKEGDFIRVDGIKYKINRTPEFADKSSVNHTTTYLFEAPEYTLIDKILTNKITKSVRVTLTGKLRDWLELLIWNVNKTNDNPLGVDTGWKLGNIPDTEYMTLSFDGIDCRSLLSELASAYGYEYYVHDHTINYVSRIENERNLTFTQGQGGGLYEVEQSNVDSGDITTRVYPVGGTKNMAPGEGDEDGRLMLPEKYLENFSETNRVVEKKIVFDNIHPSFTGFVDNPTGENYREFVCQNIDFNIKELAIGNDARINFLTGDLMGKSFEFKWDDSKKKITLIYQEDELAPIDPETQSRPLIPSATKHLRGGEEFNFTGIRLGESYKQTAILKLREKATDWLAFNSQKRVKFTLDVDYRYMRNKGGLKCGDLITVSIPSRNISRIIRIVSTEKNLKTGKLSCVVSNYLTEKWEDKIEGQISSMQATINGGSGNGNVTIIEKNDERPLTDKNVLSSLRTLLEIAGRALSKEHPDSTNYLLSLFGGAKIGKSLTFGDFITGVQGGYIGEDARAELEALVLRSSLSVPELRFNRQTYFEGYNTISPGGGLKIKSFVANSDGSYTVTPDLEDGVPLGQKPDDILLGFWHDKSVTTGDFIGFRKIQYRITSADYDEKTFVMVPRPGYEFVPHNEMRLGQTGNFTDKERQTYIIIDVRDGNCCITLVDNANTWDPEPAQMKSWFGKKKGMTINGINCDRFSAVLQDIIMTGLIFQIDEITGSTVRVPIDFPSWDPVRKYAYYSRVPHNGSTWLCVNDKGTTSEPSENNPDWLVSAAKGDKGDPGLSVVGGGHWESGKTPYKANTLVSFANCVFLSNVETSNPPIRIARFKNGAFRRKRDGGYILAGKSVDWQVHPDWEMLLDGRELKGDSITFLGEFATAPDDPKEGDSYRNTVDHCTYIYRNGLWMVMVKDGTDGKDGKGYEWIYTRTNIIGLTPDKPDSKQQDDYVPEGWTDDFLGVDQDHQVEWACKRVKRDGVWSEFSDPAPVHRWSKDGESNVMADLDNEMVSVALTSTGVTTSAQSWTTHVSMWYGTEKLTLESLTVSTPAGFTASTSKATGAVAISVVAGKSVPEQNTVTITLAAMKNGQLYTRELTFKITGVRGGADGSDAVIYSLVTSATMVSKNKNGGYSVASVSCRRMKTVGAVTTATTDGELKYSRDGSAEVPIGDGVGVASGNFTSSLKLVFYANGQVVDVETVPMVVDGSDGKDGESITAAGHWESANTPYAKNSTVTFAGGSYLSKVETSNPPIKIARFRNGKFRRKRDGGYILAGRSANRTVHADWQEMVAPVGPSASYWLDSPVSVINFTSTGTPSPSAFLVTCKQNVAGNVSMCSTLYLAARKYNGSWLAHVGATQNSQISVPATAGYTQFAVRAYKSASDANAWNDNFVAEKGIGVAKDGAVGETGATGASPRDMGVFKSGTNYVWNASYRDKIIYKIGGVYYNFLVRNYGASVTDAPTSVNGDSNWEAMQKFVNIATDTLFATGANICGFMFTYKGTDANGIPFGDIKSQKSTNGVPNLILNSETGYFHGINVDITGVINATSGTFKNVTVESGRIAGFSISGNGLTNGNKDGTFTNDAYVIFRNDPHKCFAGIGGNIFPSSSGIRGVARFENYDESDWWGLGANYALLVGARGANDNVAINMNGGYIAGLAVKTDNVSSSKTIDRSVVSVACINSSEITITLPTMEIYDDGHVISIKNMNGKRVTIKPGYSYHKINGVRTYKESYMHVDQGHHNTNSDPHSLASNGDASTYRYHRDLNNGTQYGCWIQFKNPRDW